MDDRLIQHILNIILGGIDHDVNIVLASVLIIIILIPWRPDLIVKKSLMVIGNFRPKRS